LNIVSNDKAREFQMDFSTGKLFSSFSLDIFLPMLREDEKPTTKVTQTHTHKKI
jgi:hypothetical protein